jgi:hypothetical protein
MAVALRGIPVEAALKIGGLDFAARQRHSFENLLTPECRFLIGLFRRPGALDCVLLVRVPFLLSHKKRVAAAQNRRIREQARDYEPILLQNVPPVPDMVEYHCWY